MAAADEKLAATAGLVSSLTELGLNPVLVGGMALVMLGSRRVTKDFDFVIGRPGDALSALVDLLYDQGFELASRLNDNGDVIATIDNRRVAAARLRTDVPDSAYFLNPQTGLRIDLLFDFPIPAATLAERATRTKVRSHVLSIASEPDLLQLKRIAAERRSLATDAVDIAFLEARSAGKSGN
jgi:hypothetical protein